MGNEMLPFFQQAAQAEAIVPIQGARFLKRNVEMFGFRGRAYTTIAALARVAEFKRHDYLARLLKRQGQLLFRIGAVLDVRNLPETVGLPVKLTGGPKGKGGGQTRYLIDRRASIWMMFQIRTKVAEEVQEFVLTTMDKLMDDYERKQNRFDPYESMSSEEKIDYFKQKVLTQRIDMARRMRTGPLWLTNQIAKRLSVARSAEEFKGLLEEIYSVLWTVKETMEGGSNLFSLNATTKGGA